jgi:hypothetical protein
MITFVATFLTALAAAAVILGAWLAEGFVRHQLREASRADGSRQLSLKPTTARAGR